MPWAVLIAGLALLVQLGRMSDARRRAAPGGPGLSETEARAILGVGPRAGQAEVDRAFRKKMLQAHPDRGGGDAQATKLNLARERLIKRS
ncbi:MAG TPA: J domain-containing protein [Caulobacteraceae bacterium]|jgi:DnaJ-domain-containing protein 1